MMKTLISLTRNKQHSKIKEYLESLPLKDKGPIFEEYLEYLLNGNGLLAKRVGGRGDLGADILVYNPKTPDQVDTIIQVKKTLE